MARLRVNPTRMELLKIRRRLATAVRGHKLLKDKLEGLMQEFMNHVANYRDLRREVDRELPAVLGRFAMAEALAGPGPGPLRAALEGSRPSAEIGFRTRKLMGVPVPGIDYRLGPRRPYSFLDTPAELDGAVAAMREFAEKLVELARREEVVRRLAKEVEKTKRRVNALEYVLVPNLQETRKFIASKLDENDRSNISRLMKIKDIIRGEVARG
jgi:V/A-type H+-transporting ATPase subunit D